MVSEDRSAAAVPERMGFRGSVCTTECGNKKHSVCQAEVAETQSF